MEILQNIVTPIVIATIAAGASAFGSVQSTKKIVHEKEVNDALREQKQCMRLDNIDENIKKLEKKVDIHNGYAEKFAENSKSLAVLATRMENIEKKI